MPVEEIMKEISEDIKVASSVNSAFGEPRTINNKTIIPVANVGMGVGARTGEGRMPAGGGAKVVTRPVAVLEVGAEETRLIPVLDVTRVILSSFVLGAMMTWMITRIWTGKKD